MTYIKLSSLQHYRTTIIIFIILLIAGVVLGLVSTFEKNKISSIAPRSQIIKNNPDNIIYNWDKIKLGDSSKKIEGIFGPPIKKDSQEKIVTYSYTVNPKLPLALHLLTFQNDKLVEIYRKINSDYEYVDINQFKVKYGDYSTVIDGGSYNSLSSLLFKSKDEYVITQTNVQGNRIYAIYTFTPDRYNHVISLLLPAEEDSDQGFVAEP